MRKSSRVCVYARYANQEKNIICRGPNGEIGLRLKIRNLWTFDKHPASASAQFDCPTQVAQPVDCVSIAICAARMVVSIEFSGGIMKHLLMDWCTLQATVSISPLSDYYTDNIFL